MRFIALFFAFFGILISAAHAACPYADVYFKKGMTKEGMLELEGCAAGFYDVDSMNRLATMHYLGKGTPVNFDQALHFFQMASFMGYAPSQVKLALMYWRGEGTPQNLKKAYMWLYVASGSLESRWYYPAAAEPNNRDPNAEKYLKQVAKLISDVDRRDAINQIEEHFKKPMLFAIAEELRGTEGRDKFERDFNASANNERARTQLLAELKKEYTNKRAAAKMKQKEAADKGLTPQTQTKK